MSKRFRPARSNTRWSSGWKGPSSGTEWVKDRVVLKPDIFLGNCYLLECALNVVSVERDFTFGCMRACVLTAVEDVNIQKDWWGW